MTYPSPSEFGAKGLPEDDGEALTKWLDYLHEHNVAGRMDAYYASSLPLYVRAGTTLYGTHRALCGLMAHDAFQADRVFVSVASGCRLFNVGFTGNETFRETLDATMVYPSNCNDVLFEQCGFSWWRTLVAMAATQRVTFSGCEFSHWGDSREVPQPGMCLFDGGYALLGGNGDWPNADVTVIDCSFHDGMWTAIDCLQPNEVRWSIVNTTIERVHEAGIYLGVSAVVDRCTIADVKMRDCSGHCIEGGGIGSSITNCTFLRPDLACLFLTNPVDFIVSGNTMSEPMMLDPVDSDPTPWSAAIFVRNVAAPPDKLANGLTIEGNVIAGNGRASYCVSMYDNGGGPINNCRYGPNKVLGKWKAGQLHFADEAMGENFNVVISA